MRAWSTAPIQMYEDVTGTTPNEVESGVREIMIQYMDEADRKGSSLGISRNDVTMDYPVVRQVEPNH